MIIDAALADIVKGDGNGFLKFWFSGSLPGAPQLFVNCALGKFRGAADTAVLEVVLLN